MNLIVGGDGLIGSALSDYWVKNNILFHASTKHKNRVSDYRPLIDLNNIGNYQHYKNVIICAGITNISECENNPEITRKVNVSGTIELIKIFVKKKAHIIFLSSNQVFDGNCPIQKPNGSRNPTTEYGRQKAKVEMFIDKLSNACVLRLTKVIHTELTLLKEWGDNLSSGHPVYAFNDMTLSPINIYEVIKKIDRLVREQAIGIFQLSGKKDISYYKFAKKFAKENGYLLELVKTDSWKNKLQFTPPLYTSLQNV